MFHLLSVSTHNYAHSPRASKMAWAALLQPFLRLREHGYVPIKEREQEIFSPKPSGVWSAKLPDTGHVHR